MNTLYILGLLCNNVPGWKKQLFPVFGCSFGIGQCEPKKISAPIEMLEV